MKTTSSDSLSAVVAKVANLLTWEDNWNTYGLPTPKERAVQHALHWIIDFFWEVEPLGWETPNVTGDSDGSVVLAWRRGQRVLIVTIDEIHEHYLGMWGPLATIPTGAHEWPTPSHFQGWWRWLYEDADEVTESAPGRHIQVGGAIRWGKDALPFLFRHR